VRFAAQYWGERFRCYSDNSTGDPKSYRVLVPTDVEGFSGVLSVQESVGVVLSSTDENRFDDDIVVRVLYFGPHSALKKKTHRSGQKT
jgi:hypothetical protein